MRLDRGRTSRQGQNHLSIWLAPDACLLATCSVAPSVPGPVAERRAFPSGEAPTVSRTTPQEQLVRIDRAGSSFQVVLVRDSTRQTGPQVIQVEPATFPWQRPTAYKKDCEQGPQLVVNRVGEGACFEAIYNLLAAWLVWRYTLPRRGRRFDLK